MSIRRQVSLSEAIGVLTRAGAVFSIPSEQQQLSLGTVAKRLEVSVKYLREHLSYFPNAWRIPGGEWRIPASDVEELIGHAQKWSDAQKARAA